MRRGLIARTLDAIFVDRRLAPTLDEFGGITTTSTHTTGLSPSSVLGRCSVGALPRVRDGRVRLPFGAACNRRDGVDPSLASVGT